MTYLHARERWLDAFRWLGPISLLLGIVGVSAYYAWSDTRAAKVEWHASRLQLLMHAGEVVTADFDDAASGLQGLADWVSLRPELTGEEFDGYSRRMLGRRPTLRSTTLLPGDRIARTYPAQPALVGLDVGAHPTQGAAVREMRERGASVVTGIIPLAQGGRGVVLRAPVWTEGAPPRYYGHVSAVFDLEKVDAHLNRLGNKLGLDLSLVDADAAGTTAALKLGSERSGHGDVLRTKIRFMTEEWTLSARADGAPNFAQHSMRLFAAAVMALILALGLRLLLDAWAALRKQNRLLEELASVDALTGIANRRVLLETSEQAFALSKRTGFALSVLMLDLDHFKAVNDRHGHRAGDMVLHDIAQVTEGCLRETDTLGRWGGEEFLIVAPGTSEEGAAQLAERLLSAIRAITVVSAGVEIRITASIGIAALHATDASAIGLIERADAALYRAKAAGRDRATVALVSSAAVLEGAESNVLQMRRTKDT